MLPSRSSFSKMQVFMKDKPHRWGTKLFMLCSAQTAYCIRYFLALVFAYPVSYKFVNLTLLSYPVLCIQVRGVLRQEAARKRRRCARHEGRTCCSRPKTRAHLWRQARQAHATCGGGSVLHFGSSRHAVPCHGVLPRWHNPDQSSWLQQSSLPTSASQHQPVSRAVRVQSHRAPSSRTCAPFCGGTRSLSTC